MFCRKCGVSIPDDSCFCPKCGTRVATQKEELKSFPKTQTPKCIESCNNGDRKPLRDIVLLIGGLVAAWIGYAMWIGSTISVYFGTKSTDYYAMFRQDAPTIAQWMVGICGSLVNIVGAICIYMATCPLSQRFSVWRRQNKVIGTILAIVICLVVFVAFALKTSATGGFGIWDYLIMAAIFGGMWHGGRQSNTQHREDSVSSGSFNNGDARTEERKVDVASLKVGALTNPKDQLKNSMAELEKNDFSRAERVVHVERVGSRIDLGGRNVNKGGATNKTLWVVGAVIAVAVIAALCWGVPAYNKSKSTTKFLKYVDAKWYDNIAQMIDKIDVSDARVQFALGELYFKGNGVAKNEETAIRWYRKAAEQGNRYAQRAIERINMERELEAEAERKAQEEARRKAEIAERLKTEAERKTKATQQFLDLCRERKCDDAAKLIKLIDCDNAEVQVNLGIMYANGNGVAKDDGEAVKWYRKAAEQRNANAQHNLAMCYHSGNGITRSDKKAAEWLHKAAEQGHADAQCTLGRLYAFGVGVDYDADEAVRWFRKAAKQGNARAQNSLGACYDSGMGVVKDGTEALKWYRRAAEQGYADAQCNIGECYEKGIGVPRDVDEAVMWYRRAASRGCDRAQCNLGDCYLTGIGVAKDAMEAVKYYRKAAEGGNTAAQNNLGLCYENGDGVVKDETEAVKWYRKAANICDASAQCNLGRCYYLGKGVKKDYVEAVKWFRAAAELQKNAAAQFCLGVCYEFGDGVAKDNAEAVKWYRKSAEQGNKKAQEKLREKGLTW